MCFENDYLKELDFVYTLLSDEISREIFDIRVKYFFDNDLMSMIDNLEKYVKNPICNDVQERLRLIAEPTKVFIYGCGEDGNRDKRVLEKSGIRVDLFIESDSVKESFNNIPVKQIGNWIKNENALIILGSRKYSAQMKRNLFEYGLSEKFILEPENGLIIGRNTEGQYFDYYKPREKEVFVDAGCYNGLTTLLFRKWCGDSCAKSYMFEPGVENFNKIKSAFRGDDNILINAATWHCKEKLGFIDNSDGSSRIVDNSDFYVHGVAIDDVVNDATLIKMDIEGAELNALMGAQRLIREKKPRLAICVYHKPEDIIKIPMYLIRLCPDYKFALRHYSTWEFETVLYAYTD